MTTTRAQENWLTQLPEMEGMTPIEFSAKVKNESGLVLYVPKEDEYPALFLEWLEKSQYKHGLSVDSKRDEHYLRIRLGAGILETYTDARDFINETKKYRYDRDREYANAQRSYLPVKTEPCKGTCQNRNLNNGSASSDNHPPHAEQDCTLNGNCAYCMGYETHTPPKYPLDDEGLKKLRTEVRNARTGKVTGKGRKGA